MADKRLTLDEFVAELASGMTIGIGGWGSRRKPMAAVRAILRSDLTDLTVVSYGGPDVGLLCAAGKVAKVVYGFVTLDSIPTDPHFKAARQTGAVEAMEVDEGMFYLGLLAASQRIPFLPTRAGLGSDVLDGQPVAAHRALALRRRRGAGGHARPPPRRRRGPRQPGRRRRLGTDPRTRPLLRRALPRRRRPAVRHHRAGGADRRSSPPEVPLQSLCISRLLTDGVIETPGGAHFTACVPDYGRDEGFQKEYVAAAGDPDAWAAFAERFLAVDEAGYQAAVREAADERAAAKAAKEGA